jgi:hypothetical protein
MVEVRGAGVSDPGQIFELFDHSINCQEKKGIHFQASPKPGTAHAPNTLR